MQQLRRWIGYGLVLFLVAGVMGCNSDDDSRESKIESALMAMDDGKYDTAVRILEDLAEDSTKDIEALTYLSQAYAGSAGLDVIMVLEHLESINASDTRGWIDLVGEVLGDENAWLAREPVAEKTLLFQKAMDTLALTSSDTAEAESLSKTASAMFETDGTEGLDTDAQVQMGMFALFHGALVVAELVMDDLGIDGIELAQSGIRSLYGSEIVDFSGEISDALTDLSNDIHEVEAALPAMDELLGEDIGSDLSDLFNEAMTDLDPDENGSITESELETYLNSIL